LSRAAQDHINIGSVVGRLAERRSTVYTARSKSLCPCAQPFAEAIELADKGIRIPGCVAGRDPTDLGDCRPPWQKLPPSIVMSVEDMVDAALAGLDPG